MKFDLDLPARPLIVVISDRRVAGLYAGQLVDELRQTHPRVELLTIAGEESCKNQDTKATLERGLFELGADRDTLLIALGGGVVGDITGFVAATFMRGIDYVQLPTTLLAMVDSSIGGKTGLNNEFGKNLIGAIWHPIQIVRRPELLATLDEDQFINGLIEAIKIFLTCDAQHFELVADNLDAVLARDAALLEQIVGRAMDLKLEIVGRDEREKGERAVLNFGHTVGHGLELMSNYHLLHGFGVGLGIELEARIAALDGCLDPSLLPRIHAVFARLGLGPDRCRSWSADQVWQAMQHDKKTRAKQVNYVALGGIGQVSRNGDSWLRPINRAHFEQAYKEFLAG